MPFHISQQSSSSRKRIVQKPLKAKVVVLGNTGVGKTSILLRHDGQGFTSKMSATLGASFVYSKSIHNGKEFELQIWDTAGQERFRSMVPLYMRNTSAAVLVYDITNRSSFNALNSWIKEVERNDNDNPIMLFVIANKCDLGELRHVMEEEGRQFAEQINAHFFETSALNGKGIETAMNRIAEDILQAEYLRMAEFQKQQEFLDKSNGSATGSDRISRSHSSFALADERENEEDENSLNRKNGGKKNNSGRMCCTIL